MKYQLQTALVILALSLTVSAHEGHDTPGALPPPPNGGKVAEASHDEKGSHAHEGEELEIFVEAKMSGTKILIYAHALDGNSFKTLSPSDKLSISDLKIEQPRSKKTAKADAKAVGNHWEAEAGALKDRRILVHVTLKDGAESKTAKVQIEK